MPQCHCLIPAALLMLALVGCGDTRPGNVILAGSPAGGAVHLDSVYTDIVFADSWSGTSLALEHALDRDDVKTALSGHRVVFVFSPNDRSQGTAALPNAAADPPASRLFRLAFVDSLDAEWAIAAPPAAVPQLPAVLSRARYLTVAQWLEEAGVPSDTIAAVLPYRGRQAAKPVLATTASGTTFAIDPTTSDIVFGGTWCPHTAEFKRALHDPRMQPYIAYRWIWFLFDTGDMDHVISQLPALEQAGQYSHAEVEAIRANLQHNRQNSQLYDPHFVDDLDGRWGICHTPQPVDSFPTILAGDRYLDALKWFREELHVPDQTLLAIYNDIIEK